jgi:hypothetical protein
MDPSEIQAKADDRGRSDCRACGGDPTMPKPWRVSTDPAARRLRELTDYVYEAIMSEKR